MDSWAEVPGVAEDGKMDTMQASKNQAVEVPLQLRVVI
tara:strand:- start:3514 stop:3627 length:114 start_codon:yes stop_codon:yes gene_type:complete